MRRELPPRPHIDHLKKQAKDLLDGHARRDPEALARIIDALPAFAGYAPERAASTPFALHDAQSALAREYGFASWRELREEVERRATEAAMSANFQAMISAAKQQLGIAFPEAALAAMKVARQDREPVQAALQHPLPERLPLLAVRDVVLLPGSMAPLVIARAPSRAAIELAQRATPATLALFTQTSPLDEQIREGGLHRHGCEALIRARHDTADGTLFVVVEMLRAIELRALEPAAGPDAALWARIAAFSTDPSDVRGEIVGLARSLREEASRLVGALPEPEVAREMLAGMGPAHLADAVVANLGSSVADKARFASEPKLVERLRIALALIRAQAAASG